VKTICGWCGSPLFDAALPVSNIGRGSGGSVGVRRGGGRKGPGGGRGDVGEEIVMVAVSEYQGVSANGLLSLGVLPRFLHGIYR
jgi:hypothetical protein